ncbi:MAG TPA: mannose-1-phosphate guanylyltransferase [Myxococcales bacterium]|nr:mannose-1-phosphate guanylyltransferase [Myxococcales bacterium]
MALHAIILAGGSGTRFWPLSRMKRPKQFLKLVTGRPLLAETFHRVEALCPSSRTWVVCGEDHQEGVRAALPDLPAAHLLVEPAARNTAPAIGLAAVYASAEDPDAMLVVLPSDHHVAKPEAFRAALELAAQAAERGDLLAIGIRPTRAETGYGYLRRGDPRPGGAYAVDAFVEKPDAITAGRYLQDSAYCWNAGIFVFRADAILAALSRHMPKLFEGLEQIARALPGGGGPAAAHEAFPRMPSISIDYGVMEPEANSTRRIALVPGDFGWSDVGSFAALPEVRALDARGNALAGDTLAVDCDDCVVLSEGDRLVAAVGLRGLCIVDAGDALLVVPRDRAQDVRAAVEALRKQGRLDKL